MNLDVRIQGDDELARELKATGHRLTLAIANAVAETTINIERVAKRNVSDNGTTDVGRLISGIGVAVIDETTREVRCNAPHSAAVEGGAAPHWVPIEPLKAWARRKLKDESAAYAVQRKIAEQGTKAQPFLTPARESEGVAKHRDNIIKHARKVTGS